MPEIDDASLRTITQKVDQIRFKVEELERTAQMGKTRGYIVILAVFIVVFGSLYRTYSSIASTPAQLYRIEAQAQIENRLKPVFVKQGELVFRNVVPVYQKAFQTEFHTGFPKIAELASKQSELFLLTIGERLEARISTGVRKIVEVHLQNLAKNHPEAFADPAAKEKVINKAADIYYSAGQDVAKEIFAEHTKSLANLVATIETFEAPPELKQLSNEQLIERTKERIMELLALRLSFFDEGDVAAMAPAPAPAPAAAPATDKPAAASKATESAPAAAAPAPATTSATPAPAAAEKK